MWFYMNILISINDNFIDCTLNLLESISWYNDEKLDVYLIYEVLSDDNISRIRSFLEDNNIGTLHIYYCDFSNENFYINIPHISRETYFRLYAPFILPDNLDRILYLDGDIICNGSIKELYHMSFDDNIFAACENVDPDPIFIPWINERLGRPLDSIYFNAGVLLINLVEYRKFTNPQEISSFISENIDRIWCQDQDVINKMFDHRIKRIDGKYNYQVNHVPSNDVKYHEILTHYLSPPKPWKDDYFLPFHGVNFYRFLLKKGENDELNRLVKLHIECAGLNIVKIRKLLNLIFDDRKESDFGD